MPDDRLGPDRPALGSPIAWSLVDNLINYVSASDGPSAVAATKPKPHPKTNVPGHMDPHCNGSIWQTKGPGSGPFFSGAPRHHGDRRKAATKRPDRRRTDRHQIAVGVLPGHPVQLEDRVDLRIAERRAHRLG